MTRSMTMTVVTKTSPTAKHRDRRQRKTQPFSIPTLRPPRPNTRTRNKATQDPSQAFHGFNGCGAT